MAAKTRAHDYRPEIDGLRALAVLPVVIYHLASGGSKFNLLPGGFLGVDVFFVISGYLITRILFNQRDQPILQTLKNFWAGRLRRIFPLLAVVVFSTTVAAWVILSPKAIREYLGSAFAALFSYSNLFFWNEDSYVAEASALKPLLHTWSLAVEEQFYLLYPLLLLLILRFMKRPAIALWLLLFASLDACLVASAIDSSFNFFSFTSRGWELAAGALIAIVPRRSNGKLAALGLALIGVGYLVVKDTFWHPSPTWTLLPVVGAVLVIWFGSTENAVGRLLSWRPLVAIGLISFGIYLWHWPLMAFINYLDVGGGIAVKLVEVVVPLALATATYYLVEQPFRNRKRLGSKPFAASLVALVAATVSLLVFTSINASTALRLGDSGAKSFQSFERSNLQEICGAADDAQLFKQGFCQIGADGGTPDFVVFGDSHALSLLDTFDRQARLSGRTGLFAYQSGCLPTLGVYVERKPEQTQRCHALNQRLERKLKAGKIHDLYLVARWNYYWADAGSLRLATTPRGFGEPSGPILSDSLEATLSSYSKLVDRIVLFEDTPAQSLKPEVAFKSGKPLASLSITRGAYRAYNQKFTGLLSHIKLPNNLSVFDPAPYLCNQRICPIGSGRISYYFDDDHLSMVGAARLDVPINNLLNIR